MSEDKDLSVDVVVTEEASVETHAPMHDEAYAPKPPCTCDEDQRTRGDTLRKHAAIHAELFSAGERT
jgi:hypothetical protein